MTDTTEQTVANETMDGRSSDDIPGLPVLLDPSFTEEQLDRKRTTYPFEGENEEDYESEF